jgi:hypothetical protein
MTSPPAPSGPSLEFKAGVRALYDALKPQLTASFDDYTLERESASLLATGRSRGAEAAAFDEPPLMTLARKVWSPAGLTPEDVSAVGLQLRPGRDFARVAAAKRKIADKLGGSFDRVGHALAMELGFIFCPVAGAEPGGGIRQPEARELHQPVFDPAATGHPMNSRGVNPDRPPPAGFESWDAFYEYGTYEILPKAGR